MKISQREIILGVLTLASVLGGVTWYIVDRKVDKWHGMANEIETLEQQISHHQTAIKMQENWLGELNALQSELPVFDTKKRSVAPGLMKAIKKISSKHGVDITKNSPYPEKQIGDLFELGINCTWNGTLEAMVHFLGELQQQGVRYDVRTLSVAPVGKNTGKLKGNMVIHCAFTRKPSAPEKKK
jgi:hypothetical protein